MSDAADQPLVIEHQAVPPSQAGERLDAFAAAVFPQIASRKGAQKLAKRGLLLVNGMVGEPNLRVKAGDDIALLDDPRPVVPIYSLPLVVVYEDDWLAVVDKPAGIPVSGNYARTLQRALPAHLLPSPLPDALPSPRPVHRLDAPTQGLLLIAKTARAMVELGRQFEAKTIHKQYRAICLGQLVGEGQIDLPIDDRPASTRYRVLCHTHSLTTGWTTTVDLFPATGRTHQLRLHLASLGHPILGDAQHTPGKVLRGKGLFLAAIALTFRHPDDQSERRVELPEPAKFASLRAREERRWQVLHAQP